MQKCTARQQLSDYSICAMLSLPWRLWLGTPALSGLHQTLPGLALDSLLPLFCLTSTLCTTPPLYPARIEFGTRYQMFQSLLHGLIECVTFWPRAYGSHDPPRVEPCWKFQSLHSVPAQFSLPVHWVACLACICKLRRMPFSWSTASKVHVHALLQTCSCAQPTIPA